MAGQATDGPVGWCVVDGVGLLTLAAPPVNALDAPMRAALADRLARVAGEGVRAVILTGAGRMFSAGADLREGEAGSAPTVAALCATLEALPVPVIAALPGPALGAGAALALAAHWRLGGPDAALGFPEVALSGVPLGAAPEEVSPP